MNVRFAEPCRGTPLELLDPEKEIMEASITDGRKDNDNKPGCRPDIFTCRKDVYIGVFFDGTNNNKYRDTPGFGNTNVARLYEVYPGTPAAQKPPKLKPKVMPGGKTVEREVFADQLFRATGAVDPEDFPYYRKIYIPGVGTPMPDVGDTGQDTDKKGGLGAALHGQVRLDWAMLQLLNQVHAAIFKVPLEPSVDIAALSRQSELAPKVLLQTYDTRLKAIVKQRQGNLPHIRKIRLSVFGFSRGAAAARAWANMVTDRWGMGIAGIPLQIDFLGVFDTVASVGLAKSTPGFEGHGAWANPESMKVPPTIKRCAHLVAAHEVRGSFPLDSVCQNNQLPANCKEIVYPGVHSDVGGGYTPGDQGRAAGDALKISQISLAQMYREARMAGVPLVPESAMKDFRKENFTIHADLRKDFNAYVEATRSGKVPPTNGKGTEPSFARMFPTETQRREQLASVIRRHACIALRWRKDMMERAGGIAAADELKASTSPTRHQDIEDFRGAEAELRKEIEFLDNKSTDKFDDVDDRTMSAATSKAAAAVVGPLLALWGDKKVRDVMRDKQHEWDTWLKAEWYPKEPVAVPAAAKNLLEKYVHDSRAWFKPLFRTDVLGMAPNDDDWFDYGGRDKEKAERIAQLERRIAEYKVGIANLKTNAPKRNSPAEREIDKKTEQGNLKAINQAEQELRVLRQDGQPLILGAREPYRMWGYVRHRVLFYAGNKNAASDATRQQSIEADEAQSVAIADRDAQQKKLTDIENALHKEEREKIIKEADKALNSRKMNSETEAEYRRGVQSQLKYEDDRHTKKLAEIWKKP